MMKKMPLTASLMLLFAIALPAWADDAHHPEKQAAQVTARTAPAMIDASARKMQEMRKKIETEKNPAARKELLHQHMRMMKDGMNMMTMMGGQDGMMMELKDPASMPMAERMGMMEKKMASMEKMMIQGGGMMEGMMGGMMGGGASGSPMNDRMDMMEKKMLMMQEMLNGMVMQQEMMMK